MDTNLLLSVLALPLSAILLTLWATYLHRRDEAASRRSQEAGDVKP